MAGKRKTKVFTAGPIPHAMPAFDLASLFSSKRAVQSPLESLMTIAHSPQQACQMPSTTHHKTAAIAAAGSLQENPQIDKVVGTSRAIFLGRSYSWTQAWLSAKPGSGKITFRRGFF